MIECHNTRGESRMIYNWSMNIRSSWSHDFLLKGFRGVGLANKNMTEEVKRDKTLIKDISAFPLNMQINKVLYVLINSFKMLQNFH